jgi:glycosyltransferase involved in cell wall biosynthesis
MAEPAPRIAIVHDWLIHMRGGEKVLDGLREVFPEAEIYTLFFRRDRLSPGLRKARIHPSWLHYLPGIRRFYRWLLPILPQVIQAWDLRGYDIVISSSHCVAKGCRIPRGTLHISYCHAPLRYAWGFRDDYFGRFPPIVRRVIDAVLDRMRDWDRKTCRDVHLFIANSENTRNRIQDFYGRKARVVYPPVDVGAGDAPREPKQDFFLVVSALVPYKRVELAVRAFNEMRYPLKVIGDGPERTRLEKLAGPTVTLLGSVGDDELRRHYASARALVFPGEEDFGIVPVEAQAAGCPVIAYARGGALETVTEASGVFFREPTSESLIRALREFEGKPFDPGILREGARKFSRERFHKEIKRVILEAYNEWRARKAVDNHLACATK